MDACDKRMLIGGVVLLVAWAIGEKGIPLARMVKFGMHSILQGSESLS